MFQLPYMKYLTPLLTIMLILAAGAYVQLQSAETRALDRQMPTLDVQGVGEVLAKPDIATFSFSVEAEAVTQEEAQSISAEKINAITAFLKESGIDEKDIKTSNYSVYPKYEQEEKLEVSSIGFYPPSKMVQTGYTASQQVTVKVRDIENTGTLLSGVGEKGATNISSLSLTVDDIEKVKDEALSLAIEDAQEKAEALAEQLGVRLGRIVTFNENNYYGGNFRAMSVASSAEEKSFAIPEISTGENTYSININISYTFR